MVFKQCVGSHLLQDGVQAVEVVQQALAEEVPLDQRR
jgi:hypothetical protein